MPPVVRAPSASRTYRSCRPAASAISALVDGGRSAMVSNSPVWCPMLIESANSGSLMIPARRPPNSSRRVASSSIAVFVVLLVDVGSLGSDPAPGRIGHQLGPVGHADLGVDAGEVGLDGLPA